MSAFSTLFLFFLSPLALHRTPKTAFIFVTCRISFAEMRLLFFYPLHISLPLPFSFSRVLSLLVRVHVNLRAEKSSLQAKNAKVAKSSAASSLAMHPASDARGLGSIALSTKVCKPCWRMNLSGKSPWNKRPSSFKLQSQRFFDS